VREVDRSLVGVEEEARALQGGAEILGGVELGGKELGESREVC